MANAPFKQVPEDLYTFACWNLDPHEVLARAGAIWVYREESPHRIFSDLHFAYNVGMACLRLLPRPEVYSKVTGKPKKRQWSPRARRMIGEFFADGVVSVFYKQLIRAISQEAERRKRVIKVLMEPLV